MEKIEDGLKALLESGKEKGYLTFSQVNDHLPCDGALTQVVETLKRVHAGDLPFDRTVKVSLTENLEKDKILSRMPHNLRTLEHLMEQNQEDFAKICDPRVAEDEKRKLRRLLRIRRREA